MPRYKISKEKLLRIEQRAKAREEAQEAREKSFKGLDAEIKDLICQRGVFDTLRQCVKNKDEGVVRNPCAKATVVGAIRLRKALIERFGEDHWEDFPMGRTRSKDAADRNVAIRESNSESSHTPDQEAPPATPTAPKMVPRHAPTSKRTYPRGILKFKPPTKTVHPEYGNPAITSLRHMKRPTPAELARARDVFGTLPLAQQPSDAAVAKVVQDFLDSYSGGDDDGPIDHLDELAAYLQSTRRAYVATAKAREEREPPAKTASKPVVIKATQPSWEEYKALDFPDRAWLKSPTPTEVLGMGSMFRAMHHGPQYSPLPAPMRKAVNDFLANYPGAMGLDEVDISYRPWMLAALVEAVRVANEAMLEDATVAVKASWAKLEAEKVESKRARKSARRAKIDAYKQASSGKVLKPTTAAPESKTKIKQQQAEPNTPTRQTRYGTPSTPAAPEKASPAKSTRTPALKIPTTPVAQRKSARISARDGSTDSPDSPSARVVKPKAAKKRKGASKKK